MSDLDELCSHVTYLEEGTVRYDNSLLALKEITGETKLGRPWRLLCPRIKKN